MQFYKNLSDDLHCFQAAFLMILSKYYPKKTYTYKDADKITGFKKNAPTWDSKGLLWLAKKGFVITRISTFDYKRFAREGEKYLQWFWRPDVYEWQSKNANFRREQELVQKLLPHARFLKREATIKDIDNLFKKDATVIASINPHILDKKKGYANHSVVITNVTKTHIEFNDPGLPPHKERTVTKSQFQRALHDVIGITKVK